jgi:hypothetical protein
MEEADLLTNARTTGPPDANLISDMYVSDIFACTHIVGAEANRDVVVRTP